MLNLKLVSVLIFALASFATAAATAPAAPPAPKPAPAAAAAPAPATAPVAVAAPAVPATAPASAKGISPQAKAELEKIQKAYADLKSLDMTGKLTAEFDVQGQKSSDNADLTAQFVAPNKFRHSLKDDVLVGSTGEKLYVFKEEDNVFQQADAPKEKSSAAKLPEPFGRLLASQNLSLSLAVSPDAAAELTGAFPNAEQLPDVKVDDKNYTALKLSDVESRTMVLLVDPATHLLRRASLDMKPELVAKGVPDVKSASVSVDYTKVTPNAEVKPEALAWVPPEGAKEAAQGPEGLAGKPAPDFKLPGVDGKEISLADQKGKVVILDFWATWCGPCREGLPHLDKIYGELKDKGLNVFAVNLREEKEKVVDFMKEQKLSITPLLDKEGKVGELYNVSGIPQTVIIGKDGVIKKVFVGTGPTTEQDVREAVEEALK